MWTLLLLLILLLLHCQPLRRMTRRGGEEEAIRERKASLRCHCRCSATTPSRTARAYQASQASRALSPLFLWIARLLLTTWSAASAKFPACASQGVSGSSGGSSCSKRPFS